MPVYGKYEFCHADVVCLCPVEVLKPASCMTCSLLMLVEDAGATIWKRCTPEPVS